MSQGTLEAHYRSEIPAERRGLNAARERVSRAKAAWTAVAVAVLKRAPDAPSLVDPALKELLDACEALDELNQEQRAA